MSSFDYSSANAAYGDSPKYVKKKKKSAHVSADFEKIGLILDYEVQVTLVGDNGTAMDRQYDTRQKHIPLAKVLNEYTDVKALAWQIVQASDLIPDSRLEHIEGLVQQLKEECVIRSKQADSDIKVRRDYKQKKRMEKQNEMRRQREKEAAEKAREDAENASINDLDTYVNQFYEDDMESKLKATSMVLALASRPANLDDLRTSMDGALVRALVRLLGDNYKRSMDLVCNIVTIFFYFSNFWEFHHTLMNDRVGALTIKVVEWHKTRYRMHRGEVKRITEELETVNPNHEKSTRKSLENELKKSHAFIHKQSKLFLVSFKVLLNLAEDIQVERKMYKRNITELLVEVLDSDNEELLLLVFTFLKKLSVFRENKDEMIRLNMVEKCTKFIPNRNEALAMVVLRTLFNLSFDADARDQMVKSSMIPKLVELLRQPKFRAILLRILYHLSADDSCKSMFSYTEPPAIPIVMQLIINFPNKIVPKELAALAVNLSLNAHNAKLMCQKGGLKALVERVIRCRDPVLAKIVRNISKWSYTEQEEAACRTSNAGNSEIPEAIFTSNGEVWGAMVEELTKLATQVDNADLLVELIGILAHITPKDLPKGKSFSDLIIRYSLVEFLHRHLVPGFSKEDVVLQMIIYIGALCLDEDAARMLSNSPVMKLCYDLLHEKHNDNEIVLQILFTFYRLLRHKGTGNALLYETQMPRDVCGLLEHKNKIISVMADSVLDLVCDHDEEYENERASRLTSANNEAHIIRGRNSKMIRKTRFHLHNKEWFDIMNQEDDEESDSNGNSEIDYKSEEPGDISPGRMYGGGFASPTLSESDDDLNTATGFGFNNDGKDDDFMSAYHQGDY